MVFTALLLHFLRLGYWVINRMPVRGEEVRTATAAWLLVLVLAATCATNNWI